MATHGDFNIAVSSNSGVATSGYGGFNVAVASRGSSASADRGNLNRATAYNTDAVSIAGGGDFNVAGASGPKTNSTATNGARNRSNAFG